MLRDEEHWTSACPQIHQSSHNQFHFIKSLLTYLLTPWCRVLLEKLTGLQLVKKFHAFHGTRRFISALTSVRHLSLSWASPIQSIYPHPTFWRSSLILSTHLRLGLPSGLFPSGFPTKTLYVSFSSPIRAICPAHLILLDFITRTILGEEYRSFSSSLRNLLHFPYYLDQIKDEGCGADSMHKGLACKILVGNRKGEGLIQVFRHKLEVKNGMNVKTCSAAEYGLS